MTPLEALKKYFKKSKVLPPPEFNIAAGVDSEFTQSLNVKRILVLTAHTNDPQMLAIQAKALEKYLEFDYDFVAGIDIPPIDSKWNLFKEIDFLQFQRVADEHEFKLIEVPTHIHHDRSLIFPNGKPSKRKPDFAMRCADTFQFMLGVIPWQKYSTILYLDADMFPISPIREIPTNHAVSVAGIKQIRKKWGSDFIYLWPGLVWFDACAPMRNLLSFDLISRIGLKTDVGGETNSWINFLTKSGYGVRYLNHLQSGTWDETKIPSSVMNNPALIKWLKNDYRNSQGSFFSEIYDDKFLHYRGGGNWMLNDPARELINRNALLESLSL
jgi:hypothetical protein